MSKVIKQMEIGALSESFKGVRDMVFLTVQGLTSIADNQIRLGLRKKGIRMQVVKNSLARRVLAEGGVKVENGWAGPTTVVWGGNSIAELSKELETIIKKNEKNIKVKTAVADGEEITFEQALTAPTKAQILSTILGMILSPGAQIASQVIGPASQLASQLKTIAEKAEKTPEGEPAPAA